MSPRPWLRLGLLMAVACGSPVTTTGGATPSVAPLAEPVPAARSVGPVAYLLGSRQGLTLVFCCEAGRCGANTCVERIEGGQVSLEDGRAVTAGSSAIVYCERSGVREAYRTDEIVTPGVDAVWPAERGREAMWYPDHFEARIYAPTSEELAAIVGDSGESLGEWSVFRSQADLDGDGNEETLLGVDGDRGGLYVREGAGDGKLRKAHGLEDPYLHGLLDVTGDGWLDAILIDRGPEPPELYVVDVRHGVELLHTPWFCFGRPDPDAPPG